MRQLPESGEALSAGPLARIRCASPLFAIGKDFDADLARLAAEPRNKASLKICDPMQMPLAGAEGWTTM